MTDHKERALELVRSHLDRFLAGDAPGLCGRKSACGKWIRAGTNDVSAERNVRFVRREFARLGFGGDGDLLEWWVRVPGLELPRGSLFGVKGESDALLAPRQLERVPEWRWNRWLPLAGDRSGGTFVLDVARIESAVEPVYFVDYELGIDRAAYRVASGLWPFLHGFLLDGVLPYRTQPRWWPFDRHRMADFDPDLLALGTPIPLPWE